MCSRIASACSVANIKLELFKGNVPSILCSGVQQANAVTNNCNVFNIVPDQCVDILTASARVENPGPTVTRRFKRSGEQCKKTGRKGAKGKNTNAVLLPPRTC